MDFRINDRVAYDTSRPGATRSNADVLGTVVRAGYNCDILWDDGSAECHARGYLHLHKGAPVPPLPKHLFPTTQSSKEEYPMWDGLMAYFPAALAEVAHVSFVGSRQHQPTLPTQWTRDKSTNHKDKILRHLLEGDVSELDTDGTLHAAKVAWRALANLQIILEKNGAPVAPAAANLETQHDPK